MSFPPQAGVTLGLAAQASVHFRWGPDFAATIVGVVVCNQVMGVTVITVIAVVTAVFIRNQVMGVTVVTAGCNGHRRPQIFSLLLLTGYNRYIRYIRYVRRSSARRS